MVGCSWKKRSFSSLPLQVRPAASRSRLLLIIVRAKYPPMIGGFRTPRFNFCLLIFLGWLFYKLTKPVCHDFYP